MEEHLFLYASSQRQKVALLHNQLLQDVECQLSEILGLMATTHGHKGSRLNDCVLIQVPLHPSRYGQSVEVRSFPKGPDAQQPKSVAGYWESSVNRSL